MEDLLLIYNFLKRNGNKLLLAFLMWIMFTVMFIQDIYGEHDDAVRIPNNGIISYYDFDESQTGDQVIRDNFG